MLAIRAQMVYNSIHRAQKVHENKGGIELKKTMGEILRDLRGSRTQEEISEELGITKSSWAMYERNERVPRDEVKVRISKFFKVPVQDIFYCNQ